MYISCTATRIIRLRGFTVVELLVVLSVITILASLALSAVFSARESARTIACSSNQRQIGSALLQYEAAFQYLPVGALASRVPSSQLFGVLPRVLPLLEEGSIASKINWNSGPIVGQNYELEHLALSSAFRCASDSYADQNSISYVANAGADANMSNADYVDGKYLGTFDYAYPVSLAAVRDGLSHTALVSERIVGSRSGPLAYGQSYESGAPYRDVAVTHSNVPRGQPNRFMAACAEIDNAHREWMDTVGRHWQLEHHYTHTQAPNGTIVDCGFSNTYPIPGVLTARSFHKDRVVICFADGHVSEIASTIDTQTWRALGTRDGGEQIETNQEAL